MRIVERLLWIIVALAVAMKLLHIPLASVLLILGLSSVTLLYWAFGWLVLPSPTRKDQHMGNTVLFGFAMLCLVTGVLYKVQVWPFADFQITVGIGLGALAMLLAWVHARRLPERAAYVKNILMRVAPVMAIAVLLYPISARSMILFHHRGETPERLEMWDRMHSTDDHAEKERIWLQLDSLDEAEHRARLEQ